MRHKGMTFCKLFVLLVLALLLTGCAQQPQAPLRWGHRNVRRGIQP